MKILLYIVIIIAVLLMPVARLDVADLEPVEVVSVSMEGEQILIQTDTEARGRGATAREALEDLHRRTPAIVYLDTAKYLMVTADAKQAALELAKALKTSVKVAEGVEVPLDEAGKYLKNHGNWPELERWK